jgi:hypothetical protein
MHSIPGWCKVISVVIILCGLYAVISTALSNPGISDKIFENIHTERHKVESVSADNELDSQRSSASEMDSSRRLTY